MLDESGWIVPEFLRDAMTDFSDFIDDGIGLYVTVPAQEVPGV